MKKLILSTCIMLVSLVSFTSPLPNSEGEKNETTKKISLKVVLQDIEIKIEDWMMDTDYLEIVIESSDELAIENWMTEELFLNQTDPDPELSIEPWMQDTGYLNTHLN